MGGTGDVDLLDLRPQKCAILELKAFGRRATSFVGAPILIENRRNQAPQSNLPNIINVVYTMPRQTMWAENILVMGIENPIEA